MPVIVPAVIVASGLLFNAYDGGTGQAVSCILFSGLAIALMLTNPPDDLFWRRSGRVWILAVGALAWGIFATWQEQHHLPDYAPGKVVAYVGALGALLAGSLLGWQRQRRTVLIDLMMGIYTAFAAFGLGMFWARSDGGLLAYWTPERLGRFQGTIGNVNVAAVVGAAFTLWAGHRFLLALRQQEWVDARTRRARIAYGAAFAVNLLAVILTASRLTSVMLIAALIGGGALFYARGRMPPRYWATRVLLPAGLITLVAFQFSGRLAERFDALSDGWALRVAMWSHYAGLARERLIFGYGFGSFSTVNAQNLSDPRFAAQIWAVNSPHDVVLQLLLAAGLPYCLLMLGAVAVATKQTLRTLKGHWQGEEVVIVGMILLILSSAMIDVVLDMPATVGLTMFLAGLLWGHVPDGVEVGIAVPRDDPAVHEIPIGGRLAG